MERLITEEIERWYDENEGMCLLIDGARQVGKTYAVREFAKRRCDSFLEINFLLDDGARTLFSSATSREDIFEYLDVLFGEKLIPHETVIFLDEVQECLNMVTAVKFLVEDGRFRYILSGSLLGVEMRNVRSVPVGYMKMLHMYPMDFVEFCMARGVSRSSLDCLEECFLSVEPISGALHDLLMKRFREYLIVGGMPAAVQAFIDTGRFSAAGEVHGSICEAYRADISKYDDLKKKPGILEVFERIPGELAKQNKRFYLNSVNVTHMTARTEQSLSWLILSGVALPVYCVSEPTPPLRRTESRNLLKLFMCDVGLLNHMYAASDDGIRVKILTDGDDVNFGATYENFVAQELRSNSFTPYYYNGKNKGELDLLIESDGKAVPIEVKSGKNYKNTSALRNVLATPNYDIEKAYVFSNSGRIEKTGKIVYMPVYMAAFLRRRPSDDVPGYVFDDAETVSRLVRDATEDPGDR
ncbi:MAG: ATP-binding protein [Oscillospiraceae bacterium]|nr:ATP-binding protein [Oscillospiraceae bacterium]